MNRGEKLEYVSQVYFECSNILENFVLHDMNFPTLRSLPKIDQKRYKALEKKAKQLLRDFNKKAIKWQNVADDWYTK